MSEQQKLKFTIRQDGHVTEEATGFTSHQCVDLTKQIEEKPVKQKKNIFQRVTL